MKKNVSEDTIPMVTYDTLSYEFSRMISECCAAVCSVIISITENFHDEGVRIVENIRKAPVTHDLSTLGDVSTYSK